MKKAAKTDSKTNTTKSYEALVTLRPREKQYVLRLYVTGMTPRSTEAVATLKGICEQYLEGRYDLEVIDIYQHPQMAKQDQIFASPMLVKKLPMPLRRLIGNLADEERVLMGLDLQPKKEPS